MNEARYGKSTGVEIRLDQLKWCLPTNEDTQLSNIIYVVAKKVLMLSTKEIRVI